MPALLTDAQVKAALAPMLKFASVSDLPSYWDGVIQRAHAEAYSTIVRTLLGRGFYPADIAAWDEASQFEMDLSLFNAILRGGVYGQYEKEMEKLDRAEELKSVLVAVGGVWVKPPSGNAGQAASSGGIVTQDAGVFNWSDDPADPDHGIRW